MKLSLNFIQMSKSLSYLAFPSSFYTSVHAFFISLKSKHLQIIASIYDKFIGIQLEMYKFYPVGDGINLFDVLLYLSLNGSS